MSAAVVELDGLVAGYGDRRVLDGLDVTVEAGEFVAVLGPNGSGKTTLIKVLLGLLEPMAGSVTVAGEAPKRARHLFGYVPQHRGFERDLPLRGRDLVALGLSGTRLGLPFEGASRRKVVDEAIALVGASAYAASPIGMLSGGEQQRLRIAQALLGDPKLLLLDEPLLALDPGGQAAITQLINERREASQLAVLFVTHEINPILPMVDRVLYLVGGRAALGRPEDVMTTETLSELYGAPVEVLDVGGRTLVLAGDAELSGLLGHHHHDHGNDHDHDEEGR